MQKLVYASGDLADQEVQAGETIRLWDMDVKVEFIYPREQNMVSVSYYLSIGGPYTIQRGTALLGMKWVEVQ